MHTHMSTSMLSSITARYYTSCITPFRCSRMQRIRCYVPHSSNNKTSNTNQNYCKTSDTLWPTDLHQGEPIPPIPSQTRSTRPTETYACVAAITGINNRAMVSAPSAVDPVSSFVDIYIRMARSQNLLNWSVYSAIRLLSSSCCCCCRRCCWWGWGWRAPDSPTVRLWTCTSTISMGTWVQKSVCMQSLVAGCNSGFM